MHVTFLTRVSPANREREMSHVLQRKKTRRDLNASDAVFQSPSATPPPISPSATHSDDFSRDGDRLHGCVLYDGDVDERHVEEKVEDRRGGRGGPSSTRTHRAQ